jgi:hypothetical protein
MGEKEQAIAETAGQFLKVVLLRQEYVEELLHLRRDQLEDTIIRENREQYIMSHGSLTRLLESKFTTARDIANYIGSHAYDHALKPLIIQLQAMGVDNPQYIIKRKDER